MTKASLKLKLGNRAHKPSLHPAPELAYVIGVVWGDGWTQKNEAKKHYVIAMATKDKDFAETFNKKICKVLGKSQLYSICKIRDLFTVNATSKKLFYFLDSDAAKKVIEKYPADFIRGLADSDGCVSFSWRGIRLEKEVSIANTDYELLTYVADLLKKKFHINSVMGKYKMGSHMGPQGVVIKSTKQCYALRIRRRQDIEKFAHFVGFTMKRKQEALKALCKEMEKLKKPISFTSIQKIKKLKSRGLSNSKIAKLLGFSRQLVWRYQKRRL